MRVATLVPLLLLPSLACAAESAVYAGIAWHEVGRELGWDFREEEAQAPDLLGAQFRYEKPLSAALLEVELLALKGSSKDGSAARTNLATIWVWEPVSSPSGSLQLGAGLGLYDYASEVKGYLYSESSSRGVSLHLRLGFTGRFSEKLHLRGAWELSQSEMQLVFSGGRDWNHSGRLALEKQSGAWRFQAGVQGDEWSRGLFLLAGYAF